MNESKVPWPMVSVVTLLVGLMIGFFVGNGEQPSIDEDNLSLVEGEQQHEQGQSIDADDKYDDKVALPTDKQATVLIEQLKGQVNKLTSKLKRADKQNVQLQERNGVLLANNEMLESQIAELSVRVANADGNLPSAAGQSAMDDIQGDLTTTDEPYLTQSEIGQLLSDEHSQFYNKRYRSLVKKVNEFNQQERDENWAYQMELNINDFVTNHQFGDKVNTQVNCRADRCLVQINELQSGFWSEIANEMSGQHWWSFNSVTSGSQSNDGQGINLTVYTKIVRNK